MTRYNVYSLTNGDKLAEAITLSQAADMAEVDADEAAWAIEEEGICSTGEHAIEPCATGPIDSRPPNKRTKRFLPPPEQPEDEAKRCVEATLTAWLMKASCEEAEERKGDELNSDEIRLIHEQVYAVTEKLFT